MDYVPGLMNQRTCYFRYHYWLYEWFSNFHSCSTYSILQNAIQIWKTLWLCRKSFI